MESTNMETVKKMPDQASFLSKKRADMRSELIELCPIEEKGWSNFDRVMKIINDAEKFKDGECQVYDSFERSAKDRKHLELVKKTISKCKIISDAKRALESGLKSISPGDIQENFNEAKKLLEKTGFRLNILRSVPALEELYNKLENQLHGGITNNQVDLSKNVTLLGISNNELVAQFADKSDKVRDGMHALSQTLRSTPSAIAVTNTTQVSAPAPVEERHQTVGKASASQSPRSSTLFVPMRKEGHRDDIKLNVTTQACPTAPVDQRQHTPSRVVVPKSPYRPALPLPLSQDYYTDDIVVNLDVDIAQAIGGAKRFHELLERHLGYLVELSETESLGQCLKKLSDHYYIPTDLLKDLWYINKRRNDVAHNKSDFLKDPQYHYSIMVRALRCLNPNARIVHEPSRTNCSPHQEAIRPQRDHCGRDDNRRYDKCSRDERILEDGGKLDHNRRRSPDKRDYGDRANRDYRHRSRDEREFEDRGYQDHNRRCSRDKKDYDDRTNRDYSHRSRDEREFEDRGHQDHNRRRSRDKNDYGDRANRDYSHRSRDEREFEDGGQQDHHLRRSRDRQDWEGGGNKRRRFSHNKR